MAYEKEQIYSSHEQVPVLIVGGGLVGLSQALFLQRQGVPFVLVERRATTSTLPRARGLHFRSMELYREVELDQQIFAAGVSVSKQKSPGGLRIGETMVNSQAHQIGNNISHLLQRTAIFSPSSFCFCPQDELEPILLAAIKERGGDVRFSTELTAFEQDENGVIASLVNHHDGTTSRLHADYLVAADGAHSPVRRALNITASGGEAIEHYLNIYFHADLSAFIQGQVFSQCLIENSQVRGLLVSLNGMDRWIFHLSYDPEKGETPEDFPATRCQELLPYVIGESNISIEIKNIGSWESAVRVVNHYQQGRVFLVGDAAHLMPPWGGFGGTTGIADAHNLAWKLAAVIHGQAKAALLTTYEQERRPVACLAGHQAGLGTNIYTRYGIPTATNAKDLEQQVDPLRVILGYHYSSSAVIEQSPVGVPDDQFTLSGEPGTRIPHVWFNLQGEKISTLDLAGTRFVLLAVKDGDAWCQAARVVAEKMEIDLAAYSVGEAGELEDEENGWQLVAGENALLMRPDGFVAWRASQDTPATQETLTQVLQQVLGLVTSASI